MQRVIAQLSETKDPKLFNKKINKLLDLFDKWEGNMIEREQTLLQGTSKKVSGDQYTEQRQKEVAQLQQQKDLEERIIRVEEKERTLFAEKARLEEILEELNAAEMNMEEKKRLVEIKKQEQAEKKARKEAMQSRINEKGQELAEQREIYNQRLARLEEESIGVSNEKNRVMKDWQNVIGQAENLRLAEKEKLALQEQLKVVGEQIQQQNLILERKYQSLHNMHQHQVYKQAIDQREQALRLKEENIKLLAKELAVLQNTQTNQHKLPIQSQQSQQLSNYSYQPNSLPSSQRLQPNKQSQQQQQQFQNFMNTQNINNSNSSSLLSRSQDPQIKQQLLLSMPPLFPAASNDPSTLAASSKKIKSKFIINQSQDDDSQIQSPIYSAINPLLTTVSASPLNETSISRINHIPEESVSYQQYDPMMNLNQNNNNNGNLSSSNNMINHRNGNYQEQSSQDIQNQQESEYFQSLLAKKQQLLSRYEEPSHQGDKYHWRQQQQQYF